MVLELALLDVQPGQASAFEAAFQQAEPILRRARGYVSHELQRCLERRDRYLLLVRWQHLEDHTAGFRESEDYQIWRRLLHGFYESFPAVEHYEPVAHAEDAEKS